ncbi:hypothetical protein [Actinoplanes sp. NPDC023714]|uniref:hypothetical protein n=1 Tax=Actinoplanes sp. NPDC023714 TaxID=3154322 RepID=UPI0033DC1C5D
MINRPADRDRYPERVAHVRDLVARDDAALAAELVGLAADNDDVWRFDGAEVRRIVETLPPARRDDLILRVTAVATGGGEGRHPVPVGSLLHWLGRGLRAADLSGAAGAVLIGAASRRPTGVPAELAVLGEVAVRENGEVPPGLLAVMRRSARWMAPLAGDLRSFLDDPAEPLNAGEVWAEAANAAAARDETVRALIAHALRSKGAAPSAKWSKEAVALTASAGRAESRALIHGWFTLVPRERTIALGGDYGYDVDAVLDVHNAEALRGLLHVIAVTRAEPGDAEAVGALAHHAAEKVPGYGPRSPIVANAAVLTLESLGDRSALAELRRLRAAGPMPGMARRLDQAIARRAAALNA